MKIISSKQYVSEILKARKAQVIKENAILVKEEKEKKKEEEESIRKKRQERNSVGNRLFQI